MNIPPSNLKRVVIIGAGFAGIQLANHLKKDKYQVVLIDRHNYHTFQPLLYQVATAGLEPDSIAYTVRNIFQDQGKSGNFFFRVAEISQIVPDQNLIYSNIGNIKYDHLVISTGSTTNFYGNKNVEEHAMAMKSVPEALNLRSLLLQNFEEAILETDLAERERLMNYVIVGGGPTGVELAGALAELKNHVLPKDYPELDMRRMHIHLVDATDRVLAAMSSKASENAKKYLEKLGVELLFNTFVEDYDGQTVKTNNKNFEASTLIWAAGVKGAVISGLKEEAIERSRFLVDANNKLLTYDNVYAIGDVACMKTEEKFPNGHPMVAQVAIQQGKHLANTLNKIALGRQDAITPFKYNDKGSMATIGRNKAVVDLPNMKFKGFFAWLVWMFIHLVSLVGFRNKVIALINWVMQYFSYDKHVRLIIRPVKRKTAAVQQVNSFKDL